MGILDIVLNYKFLIVNHDVDKQFMIILGFLFIMMQG